MCLSLQGRRGVVECSAGRELLAAASLKGARPDGGTATQGSQTLICLSCQIREPMTFSSTAGRALAGPPIFTLDARQDPVSAEGSRIYYYVGVEGLAARLDSQARAGAVTAMRETRENLGPAPGCICYQVRGTLQYAWWGPSC